MEVKESAIQSVHRGGRRMPANLGPRLSPMLSWDLRSWSSNPVALSAILRPGARILWPCQRFCVLEFESCGPVSDSAP
jgi:hypothetical protein